MECLLAGSGGSGAGNASLLSPERLLQLLDSPDALPLLQPQGPAGLNRTEPKEPKDRFRGKGPRKEGPAFVLLPAWE